MTRSQGTSMTLLLSLWPARALRCASLVALLLGACAGCGGGDLPPPGVDGGGTDLGFRDGGVPDMAIDMTVPPADMAATDQGGGVDQGGGADQGAGADQGGGVDQGGTGDMGVTVGSAPVIGSVSWTAGCAMGSNFNLYIVVDDDDTTTFDLMPTVTGMGSCFVFPSSSVAGTITVMLSNCASDATYTPTITVRDPEGNTDSVSGFDVVSCTSGAFFP